jgi:hypothetical protein
MGLILLLLYDGQLRILFQIVWELKESQKGQKGGFYLFEIGRSRAKREMIFWLAKKNLFHE